MKYVLLILNLFPQNTGWMLFSKPVHHTCIQSIFVFYLDNTIIFVHLQGQWFVLWSLEMYNFISFWNMTTNCNWYPIFSSPPLCFPSDQSYLQCHTQKWRDINKKGDPMNMNCTHTNFNECIISKFLNIYILHTYIKFFMHAFFKVVIELTNVACGLPKM